MIENTDKYGLNFKFGDGNISRSHTVWLYESDGYCIFMGKAITSKQLHTLGSTKDKKIIEYTWMRNRNIDVVEFLLDSDKGISGRAFHPVKSLDWEEFIFCSYTLALEVDRLEYVFNQEDIH